MQENDAAVIRSSTRIFTTKMLVVPLVLSSCVEMSNKYIHCLFSTINEKILLPIDNLKVVDSHRKQKNKCWVAHHVFVDVWTQQIAIVIQFILEAFC